MACLELVSPCVTQFQSSLFLWVVAPTLHVPRKLISPLLVFFKPQHFAPVSYGDMGHVHSFPQELFPTHGPSSLLLLVHHIFIPLSPLLHLNLLL